MSKHYSSNQAEIMLRIAVDSQQQAFGTRSLTTKQKAESSSPVKKGHGGKNRTRASSRHK